MPKIKYNQAFIEVAEDSILLDSLLSSGNSIPYSCRSGTCQSCLMKSESKNLPTKSQEGLHPNQKIQGYLLACQHQVTEDIEVCMPSDAGLDIFCNIHSLKLLNDNVMQVTLKPQKPLTAEPGQYINLIYNNSLARSYSIASIHDDLIELHVKNVKNGRMSNILFNYAKVGHEFMLRGPIGNCFYSNQHHNNTIILAGTGTGLAPLWGILNKALESNHIGDIYLFQGGRNLNDLYFVKELENLNAKHNNFKYIKCLLDENNPLEHNIEKTINLFTNKSGIYAFFCGNPAIVSSLKQTIFLAGVSSSKIASDAFIMSK